MSTERFELIAPCHFGLEAVLKREILDLGYEISKVEDGKVTFLADAQGIADANVFLRTTERILLKVAEVKAETFDELFEATKALPWERYIPADGKFWIAKANSVKSKSRVCNGCRSRRFSAVLPDFRLLIRFSYILLCAVRKSKV